MSNVNHDRFSFASNNKSNYTATMCTFASEKPRYFVCSYPKSGTTWTQYIVYTLATRGCKVLDHISNYAPFYEIDATWHSDTEMVAAVERNHTEIGRRIFNTHLWPSMLPKGGAKFIYLLRDGRDVVTSFFHHLSHQSPEDGGFVGDFTEFFDDWLAGKLAFGSWSQHVKKWMHAAVSDSRILILRYEDMKSDLESCIQRINEHCGFGMSPVEITSLLPKFSFDHMRSNLDKFSPRSVKMLNKNDNFAFLRKGAVGDHRQLFTAEHVRRFDAMYEREFANASCDPLNRFC
eukprot:m.636547 g.636547  ORF g.636547 m.636547 type:complete len:290 (-) comp22596_c0_seq4:637-1506(-)